MTLPGKRIADEDIYLSENRYEHPKELFKFIGNLIADSGHSSEFSLLDAGCATGEFLYFLDERFAGHGHFAGLDISAPLIEKARAMVPNASFVVGGLSEPNICEDRSFDVVTCCGVLGCLDDPAPAIMNLLGITAKNGTVLVSSSFNPDPIDVIVRYRRAEMDDAPLEAGWNVFSHTSIERILKRSGRKLDWAWHSFEMPFDLEKKTSDPMRSWTVKTEFRERQLVNGACQLINGEVLVVRVLN